jgi:hypothetical protein
MKKNLIYIFGLLLFAGNCFAANLLPETVGGFEQPSELSKIVYMWNPAGKELGELLRLSTAESYRGKSSLEVHSYPPKSFGIFVQAAKRDFKAGETYTASVYVKAPQTMNILIYLMAYNKLWKEPRGTKFAYTVVGSSWKQLKVTFKLPKDAKIVGTIVRVGGKETAPKKFYLDELKIEPGRRATASEPGRIESNETVNFKGVIPVGKAPVIDGKLSEPVWENALTIDKFYLTDGSGRIAPQATEVKMLHDGENIYFGFKCSESNIAAMRCRSTGEKTDWSDDRVEIHANPTGYREAKAYFSVNAAGVYTTQMPFTALKLKPEVKTAKGRNFWTAEIAIPAAAYGKKGLAGQTWYFSLGRFHRTSFKGASCLAPIKGGFNQLPAAFQPFVFSVNGSKQLPAVVALTQGDMAEYSNNTARNAIKFQLNDKKISSSPLQLTVTSIVNAKPVAVQTKTVKPPFKDNRATFYYNTAERDSETLIFNLKSNDKTIFLSQNNLATMSPLSRVFKTPNPLFKELLQEIPVKPRTFISWQHPLKQQTYFNALKYGKAYSQAKRLREMKDASISIVVKDAGQLLKVLPSVLPGNYYWDRNALNMELLSSKVEYDQALPFTVYGYYSISGISPAGKRGVTLDKNGYFGWLPDPINSNAYIESVKAILNQYGTYINTLWIGDEQFWLNHDNGLKMNSLHNRANPTGFLQKANQEVKEKYGFGKFGIPWNMSKKSPDYPYSRRAYISWLHDKLLATNKKIRSAVKAKYPNMPVMSDDAYGCPSVVGVQYWYQYADIATFQLGEGGGMAERNTESYMFTTKMVKDLSGIKNLSVVPHEAVDGYPSGATTLEEARELYSQALRGGSDGFHYWPSSFNGRHKPPIFAVAASEGYPQAWQYMLEVTKLLNTLPPLKIPVQADSAIFVSDEALKCDSRPYKRFASAFALLGSSAHAWFKFISDTMLEQGRAKLSNYKIIYIPYIEYVKEATIKQLIKYVENGGTLICGDPKAFENDISSALLRHYREKLFGVKSITPNKSPDSAICLIGNSSLPTGGSRFSLELNNRTKIIGSYSDGSPAVVENRLGKGKAIYFGFVSFSRQAISSDGWKKFFKDLHVAEGGSIGYDIWRFKLPSPKIKPITVPSGKCLTGNYAYWNRHELIDGTIFNLQLNGLCTINRNGKLTSTSFKQSKLTDRRTLFTRIKEYDTGAIAKFVETFDRTEPVSIAIDLKDKFQLDRLLLYYAGNLPKIKVSVSNNQQQWLTAGHIPSAKTASREIKELKFNFTNMNSRYLKLDFTMQAGKKLILSEIELWQK